MPQVPFGKLCSSLGNRVQFLHAHTQLRRVVDGVYESQGLSVNRVIASHEGTRDWVYDNMKYFCANKRASIIADREKIAAEDAVQTKAACNFKKFLGVDFNQKVNEEDNEMFQEKGARSKF